MHLRPIKQKKGQVGGIATSIIALGVAAIVLVLILVILQELRDTDIVSAGEAINDTAFEQANNTIVGIGTFADFWTIIVLAIVAAIVIGIIFGAFGGFARRR